MKLYTTVPLFIKVALCIFIATVNAFSCFSQNDSIVDHDITSQIWVDFRPSWKLSERTTLNTIVSYRRYEPKSNQNFVTRAEAVYELKELNLKNLRFNHALAGGVSYFIIDNFNATNAFEYRLHQGYKLSFKPTNRTHFKQYLRLEERFTNLFRSNSSFGLRLRYRIRGIINLEGLIFNGQRGFYIPTDLEFFFNIKKSKQINDVIRLSPGIGYVVDPSFKVQFNVGYHYTRQEFDELIRTNDIIFQLRAYKTFPLKRASELHPVEVE
ncbi:DUF2490 domain-containing protein [Galbibacter mesophilus]|uniref:DUF2490 domain-containing protein n=1 Tax=Galbibacter mesophilus TaxID=379069 RepID=UPI00191C9B8C|nr:DUF2490 domain-containing protein [Galbibacter mesophilus]MCM5661403.1 DUF2490 domain-containing protein [Galbibacter mesophilus]